MNVHRGWTPLAITQFLSARYQQAEPGAGLEHGRDRLPRETCASSGASIRVPAIESPMTT